jgi:uncharacterized protein
MRIAVRVRPGSSRDRAGGRYDGPAGAALVVAVTAPAVDGRATAAAIDVVADAFGVRRRAVRLVSGATARDKVLEIDGDPAALAERFTMLLG